MTPLRQRMTEDMQLRGVAPATQQAYLRYVEQLAVFTGTSPDLVTDAAARPMILKSFSLVNKAQALIREQAAAASLLA